MPPATTPSTLLGADRIPPHLRRRLAITLWDFSWYTRAGEGEPFADPEAACAEAVERGYTALRICAAPLLTSGVLGLDPRVAFSGLGTAPDGGVYGRGTRWYDAPGGYALDVRERLLELLAAARRHGLVVVLSSWEYQQSSAFAADERWWRAMDAVPVAQRYDVLADAWDRLLVDVRSAGLDVVVAFVELHNEVDFSLVPAWDEGGAAALARLRGRHPQHLVTASWGKPPHLDMASLGTGLDVAQHHVYAYGVLDALQARIDIRAEGTEGFPNAALRALLRDDAPTPEAYGRPEPWRFEATVITGQMVHGYDWIDPDRWDLWLYEHYGEHRRAMEEAIDARLGAVAAWARRQGVPFVVGEGWIGYTPLHGTFEEGPVGRALAERGVRRALRLGAWGVVPTSNAAPHHPLWADVAWQRRVNALVTSA
ncbi:cellulase-like family protein [Cellulomonas endophytica]|uniref:cellulase-like family protein n=1 Tax=Cellulomonas endophytica TaxID=2494735 RepID=UPI0010102EC6|nr:cellulase-like family protein [Cellulomonas endophytica]